MGINTSAATCLRVVFLLSLLLWASAAEAQRLIERGMVLNPLANPAVDLEHDQRSWFPQVGGWASFGNYGMHTDDDHGWYQHLGAYLEIYRRGNRSSLAVTNQIEFIADYGNDINFNPRAIFWEEGIFYTRNLGGSFLQLGYYHRCKHDIDNLESGRERTLIFGSVMSRLIFPVSFVGDEDALVSVQYDHYTITWDRRTPAEFGDTGKKWDTLVGSLKLNTAWTLPVRPPRNTGSGMNLYFDGYGMATLYGDGFWFSGHLRAEIGTRSRAGEMRFGLHFEYLGDTGIPVNPAASTLAGIGIRIMTPGSIR